MSDQPKKPKRKRRILFVILVLLLCFGVVGWLVANSVARSKIENQLIAAGVKSPQIGSVRVGFGGVTASDIQIDAADGVKVDIQQLSVQQSIFQLARGVTPMDAIVVSGGEVSLDSRAMTGDSSFSLKDLDLEKISLPAQKIELDDFHVAIFDEDGRVELAVQAAELTEVDGKFELSAATSFLDGPLEFNGNVTRSSGKVDIEFSGQHLHLVDQKWQKWPGIGPAVLRHLGADSVFDLNGKLGGSFSDGIRYLADIDTKDASLYIPKFKLPIAIREADVRIEDGLVSYRKVVAALGDGDVVNATGSTSIDGLPCRSKFEGDFTAVDVADLRKLVKEIPVKVKGTATGVVVGSVDVNEALETTLRIDAKGDTAEASFGNINASTGYVDVQIQPLVLTQLGKTIDLQGAVTVKATTKDQNVDGVLATFDLQALDRQFEFEMLGSGKVDLVIPLNSAADLRTWDMKINSTANAASVGGMKLQDLKLTTFLEDGQLVFQPTTAVLADDPTANVNVFVKWPLPNNAVEAIAETGEIRAAGSNLPPREAIKFFDRQMANANIDYQFKSQVVSLATSGISGAVNFESTIILPAAVDRPIKSWNVAANVLDSTVDLGSHQFEKLRTGLTIKDGILQLKDLEGQLTGGGSIKAGADINLVTSELSDVFLNANRFPATWLGSTIVQLDSSGEFSRRTGLNNENVGEKLGGFFDATIKMDNERSSRILWNAHSDHISIFGKPFRALTASGQYENDFSIQKLKADLPGGGKASMDGDWVVGSDAGELKLRWNGASVSDLLENELNLPESFSSLSKGEMTVSFEDSSPVFAGTVDLIEPKGFGGTFADHRFNVQTTGNRISFEDVETGDRNGLNLKGWFEFNRPFAFEVTGATKSMPLSTAVFDQLSGYVTSKFTASGEASAWKLKSSGMAKVEQFGFENTLLSDIKSKWDFDTTRNEQRLIVDGFGGRIELDSANSTADDLVFDLNQLDLAEFAVFRKLPVKLSGIASGKTTIGDWRNPETRTLRAAGVAESVSVGRARISNVAAKASLTDGGQQLAYSVDSQMLDGKFEISGATKLKSGGNPFDNRFPLKVRLTNARMRRFAESISTSPSQNLRQLQGRISVAMDWDVTPGKYPGGSGKVSIEDAKWKNRLVSRKIQSDISLNDGIMQLKNIRADLQQGEIAGRATIPLVGSAAGAYQLDVRNFSLKRMMDVLLDDPIQANGQINARISGRTGRTITGRGTLGVSRAGLFGVSNQAMKLPIRFRVVPQQRTARIEMPRTRFKAFQGNVSGSASIDIGSRLRMETKLDLANIDSQTLIRSLTGYNNTGNGKLNGRLELSSRNIRTANDLNGTFRGDLKQSTAFSFPLLDQVTRFLGNTASLRSNRFNSDSIDLVLSKGRVNVRQFRLQNSLASISVSGDAWLDGRLDMEVAARVERLDQPTLIDQLAGSPIARLTGPQAVFFAQAAEFLSERIVFLDVGGTTRRPQLRLNPGKLLKEEAIRYFLRGSQILPNTIGQNN